MTSVVVVEVKSIKGECPKHGPKHAKHQVKMVNWSMTSVVVVVVVVESIKGEATRAHAPVFTSRPQFTPRPHNAGPS